MLDTRILEFRVRGEDGATIHVREFPLRNYAHMEHNSLHAASMSAHEYRDGFFAGKGWRLAESWNEEGGGYHGRVNIPYSGNLEWHIIMLDF